MNAAHNDERLRFLLETVALEAQHLQGTDQRLFAQPFITERAAGLQADVLLPLDDKTGHDQKLPPGFSSWQWCAA